MSGAFSRRKFISASSGLGAGAYLAPPLNQLVDSILKGIIGNAQADSLAQAPRNYVNILIPGAPPRFCFDHFLRTNESDPAVLPNRIVSNCFLPPANAAGTADTAYKTIRYNNLLVPHFFSHSLVTSSGTVPATSLLENMLVVRGTCTDIDGHLQNALFQQTPISGLPSISGAVADASDRRFGAVQMPGRGVWSAFASKKGRAVSNIGAEPFGALSTLLKMFQPIEPTGAKTNKERRQNAYDRGRTILKKYISDGLPGSESLSKSFLDAEAQLKVGIAGVDQEWAALMAKYRNAIEASVKQRNLPGISDFAIRSDESNVTSESPGGDPAFSRFAAYLFSPRGLHTLIQHREFDLRDSLANVTCLGMASGFALAEYLLLKNLSSVVEIGLGFQLDGLLFRSAFARSTGTKREDIVNSDYSLAMDMHEMGQFPSLYFSHALFRGVAGGILELSQKLRATRSNGKSLFDETVIHLTTEFERAPRSDGTGSDHGFNAGITSAFSGAIKRGPIVVGNVFNKPDRGPTMKFPWYGYEGSWGLGAPMSTLNGLTPNPSHVAATIAALLRLPTNFWENTARPLIVNDGDSYVAIEPAKVINAT